MFNLQENIKQSDMKMSKNINTQKTMWLKQILCIAPKGYYPFNKGQINNDDKKMNIAKYVMLLQYTRHLSKRAEVELNTKGKEVVKKLITSNLSGLPIINNEHDIVNGIISEHEILDVIRDWIEEGIISYKQSINVIPDNAEAHLKLGILNLLLKNRRSALEEYKILKKLFPSMADALLRKWNIKTPF